jgi:hypothetical protein
MPVLALNIASSNLNHPRQNVFLSPALESIGRLPSAVVIFRQERFPLGPAACILVYVCTPFMHASNILTPCRNFYYTQLVQVLPCLLNLSVIGKGTTSATPYFDLTPIAIEVLPANGSFGPHYFD